MELRTIELVKELSRGPCSCRYDMSCGSVSWNETTKRPSVDFDRGPCTHTCIRCRARASLENDNIEYEKDDHVNMYDILMSLGGKPKIDCASAINMGETFTVTSSIHPV